MALWICYDLLKGWALPPCWHHFGTVFFERPWPTSMWKATLKLNWSFSSLIHSCNVKRKPSWVISLKNHDGTLAGVNLPERQSQVYISIRSIITCLTSCVKNFLPLTQFTRFGKNPSKPPPRHRIMVNMAPTVEAHTANDDIMIIYYLKLFKMYLFHGTQNMLFWF